MDGGTRVRPAPVPGWACGAALALLLGLPALVGWQRVQAAHAEDLVQACQGEYAAAHDLGAAARTAAAAGDQDGAERAVRAYVREVRRVPVCWRDADVQAVVADLERGLREGPLAVPPEPRGTA